jgi:hypothetical protein
MSLSRLDKLPEYNVRQNLDNKIHVNLRAFTIIRLPPHNFINIYIKSKQ